MRFWKESLTKSGSKTRILAALLAVLFATAQVLGLRMDRDDRLGVDTGVGVAVILLLIAVTACIYAVVLLPLLHFFAKYDGARPAPYRGLWALPAGRRRLLVVLALVIPWGGYWLLLWPGVTTNDSLNQLVQALGLVEYSDHHPIVHTLLIQGILQPAVALTGSLTVAISVVTLIQMIALATVFGIAIDALREFKVPGWSLSVTLVVFAVGPLTGWYSVTLWKDVWLGALLLAFATVAALVVWRARSREQVGWRLWLVLFVVAVGVMFAKKTGIYIVAPSLVMLAILVTRTTVVRLLAVGLASLTVYLTGYSMLMTGLNVQPGSEAEAWSLPSQQIARVAAAGGFSPDDEAFFGEFFPGIDLGEAYKPHISDPIKNSLDVAQLDHRRSEFITAWIQLGAENPVVFAEATLAQTYGYWYPGALYWMVSSSDLRAIVDYQKTPRPELDTIRGELDVQPEKSRIGADLAAVVVNKDLREIPVFGQLLSIGLWSWLGLLLCAIAYLRKQRPALAIGAIGALVWVTCMISPVHAEARYAYPMFLILPALALLSLAARVPGEMESPATECLGGPRGR